MIVGAKKPNPCTVMFVNKKMKPVVMVVGLRIPREVFFMSILSKTSVVPTRSLNTRLAASAFSAGESQRAVSGRSVMVRKPMRARPMVMMPVLCQWVLYF